MNWAQSGVRCCLMFCQKSNFSLFNPLIIFRSNIERFFLETLVIMETNLRALNSQFSHRHITHLSFNLSFLKALSACCAIILFFIKLTREYVGSETFVSWLHSRYKYNQRCISEKFSALEARNHRKLDHREALMHSTLETLQHLHAYDLIEIESNFLFIYWVNFFTKSTILVWSCFSLSVAFLIIFLGPLNWIFQSKIQCSWIPSKNYGDVTVKRGLAVFVQSQIFL